MPELRDVPEDVEAVSIFINDRIDEAFLERHPALRMIATRSMGVDHIDLEACAKRRIVITHVSGYGENTVAEHTFALMLALSRRIRESTEAALAGKFTHEKFRGTLVGALCRGAMTAAGAAAARAVNDMSERTDGVVKR
jgi:D-lactate dehydrogenase